MKYPQFCLTVGDDPMAFNGAGLDEGDADLEPLGLHIAAVSYEGSLFGWDVLKCSKRTSTLKDQEGSLVLKFGFHCSVGSLRAVAVSSSGKFLVCGGMNERIQIFDLSLNKSLGELSQHTG